MTGHPSNRITVPCSHRKRNTTTRRSSRAGARTGFPALLALCLLLSGCSPKGKGPTEAEQVENAERAFNQGVVDAIAPWATAAVPVFFDAAVATKTASDEATLRDRVRDFEATKTAARAECEQFKKLEATLRAIPSSATMVAKEARDRSINRAIDGDVSYATRTAEIRAAAGFLQQVFAAQGAERDRLIERLFNDNPNDPNVGANDPDSVTKNLDNLRELGFLGPGDTVLTPDANDPAITGGRMFQLRNIRFGVIAGYLAGPLYDQIKPCIPGPS